MKNFRTLKNVLISAIQRQEYGFLPFSESLAAILANREVRQPEVQLRQNIPISPGTSCRWSDQSGRNGWSARMFVHQMCLTLFADWNYSDTELLLSNWMVHRLRPALDRESSVSDVLTIPWPDDLKGLALKPKTLRGLIRRAAKHQRNLCHVYYRLTQGSPIRRTRLTFTSQDADFVNSPLPNVNALWASRKDGPKAFLLHVAPSCSENPSTSDALSGSAAES